MRNLILASMVAIPLCSAVPTFAGQSAAQEAPPVIQTQANPTGPGTPTDTPPNPATAESPVAPAMPADPSYNAGPYKGALTQPPSQAMDKTYPLCTRTLQDSCVNPSEAGVRPALAQPRHRRVRHSRHN